MTGIVTAQRLHRRLSGMNTRAIEGLGSAAATPEILNTLLRRLKDANRYVRWAAVEAIEGLAVRLGSAATPEILNTLLRRLTATNEEVRKAAAQAIGRLMVQRVRIFQVSRRKWEGQSVEQLAGEWERLGEAEKGENKRHSVPSLAVDQ